MSFAALFFPYVGVLSLLGIIFFIIGNRKLKKARNSRYTSEKGEHNEKIARILQIVIIVAVSVLLIAGALFFAFYDPLYALIIGASFLLLAGIILLFSNIFLRNN